MFFFKKNKKLGLVLSGGAARGIAHLGVLKAFEEFKFPINHIFGSSAGAIIGGLYACGVSIAELEEFLQKISITDFIKFKLSRHGMFSSEAIAKFMQQFIGNRAMSDTNIPLSIIATNILTGKGEYFFGNDIPVTLAASASASIPGIFSPTKINNSYYVDGAVSAHLPIPENHNCDVLIGCNAIPETTLDALPNSVYSIVDRAIDCALRVNSELATKNLDFVMNPLGEYIGSIDLKSRNKLVKYGYECVTFYRKDIEKLL